MLILYDSVCCGVLVMWNNLSTKGNSTACPNPKQKPSCIVGRKTIRLMEKKPASRCTHRGPVDHLHVAIGVRNKVLGQRGNFLLQNLVGIHARTRPEAANCVEPRVIGRKGMAQSTCADAQKELKFDLLGVLLRLRDHGHGWKTSQTRVVSSGTSAKPHRFEEYAAGTCGNTKELKNM